MRNIQVLGVPFDFGQPLSGVKNAYRELEDNGLFDLLDNFGIVKRLGEMNFNHRNINSSEGLIKHSSKASFASKLISHKIENLNLQDDLLINIGGDHGMSLGTIHGVLCERPESVVVWVDAHGDINTPETSQSGNFHGMPLSFLLNIASHPDFEWMTRFLKTERLILIGPRDLDPGEKDIIEKYSIQYYSSSDLSRIGAKEVLEMALHRADPAGTRPIHLSFDVDVFDAADFTATGTRVHSGPRLEDIFLLGGLLGETGRLMSMDLVEFNPDLEQGNASVTLILDFLKVTLDHTLEKVQNYNVPTFFSHASIA